MRQVGFALVLALAMPAAARAEDDFGEGEDAEEDGEDNGKSKENETLEEAKRTLTTYLERVKKKDWNGAKKLTHAKTVAAIADMKKRTGNEAHSMAPWYWAKDSFYVTGFKIHNAYEAPLGTVVVTTLEDNFQVQEKGMYEGEAAAYLLYKDKDNDTWSVVDKKNGADAYTDQSIEIGYPGYFAGAPIKKPKTAKKKVEEKEEKSAEDEELQDQYDSVILGEEEEEEDEDEEEDVPY